MERTCERAVQLGLPAVAFTEHADYTPWMVIPGELDGHDFLKAFVTPDGNLTPPPMDVQGYLESLQRCRDKFPDLRIIGGVELGEAHWHPEAVAGLLDAGQFERVLGSLHCLRLGDRFAEPPNMFREFPAADVIRQYLAEVVTLTITSDVFTVLAHLDYPTRYWPEHAEPFDAYAFQDEFRHALRTLADNGRALEVNTAGSLRPEIVRWWHEEGGEAITFGSDAHEPEALARGFVDAAAMVEANGFRPGRHPYDFWVRIA
jgi:histidinol-phosphatase (PHP family)